VSDLERWIELVPTGQTATPSFWWSGLRLVQSAEKLQKLQTLLAELVAGWQTHPVARIRRDAGLDFRAVELENPEGDIQPEHKREASLLASELLFHVRTALDYAVYQAAWRNSGQRQQRTAFPLCLVEEAWPRRRRDDLKGLSQAHIELIEKAQPFNGVGWTLSLASLSNRDKHRTAVEVTPTYGFKVDLGKRWTDPLGDDAYYGLQIENPKIRCLLIPEGEEPSEIGIPAVEALAEILDGAARLVNIFLSEEGQPLVQITYGPVTGS